MTYIVLHADQLATALADDPIVPAEEVGQLNGAIGLFAEAGRIRAEAEAQAAAARTAGHAEGFAAGHAEGLDAGAVDVRAELFRLAIRDGEERRNRQAAISALALEVVRRIVGEIGEEKILAGLAERATAALAPDVAATVRVPPAHAAATRDRLADRPQLIVEADPDLAGTDCIVETAIGRSYAGLDIQLGQIEAAWKDAAR